MMFPSPAPDSTGFSAAQRDLCEQLGAVSVSLCQRAPVCERGRVDQAYNPAAEGMIFVLC